MIQMNELFVTVDGTVLEVTWICYGHSIFKYL